MEILPFSFISACWVDASMPFASRFRTSESARPRVSRGSQIVRWGCTTNRKSASSGSESRQERTNGPRQKPGG